MFVDLWLRLARSTNACAGSKPLEPQRDLLRLAALDNAARGFFLLSPNDPNGRPRVWLNLRVSSPSVRHRMVLDKEQT